MRNRKKAGLVVSLAIIIIVCGVFGVSAQQGAPPGGGVNLDVTVRSDKSLTGQQQLDWVKTNTAAVKSAYFRVQNMLDTARKSKDTLKITCLDDKLTQIHVHMKGIEDRTARLKVAVRGGDKSSADQQFAILKIYITRIQGLVAEAENCIGDVDVVLGESETVVTVDEDIAVEDPSGDEPPDGTIEIPPTASGYK